MLRLSMLVSMIADILLHWVCIFHPWIIDQHLGYSGKEFCICSWESYIFLPPDPLCFLWRAASLHVFPGQWQSCSNEAWSCKINYDGSTMTNIIEFSPIRFSFFILESFRAVTEKAHHRLLCCLPSGRLTNIIFKRGC